MRGCTYLEGCNAFRLSIYKGSTLSCLDSLLYYLFKNTHNTTQHEHAYSSNTGCRADGNRPIHIQRLCLETKDCKPRKSSVAVDPISPRLTFCSIAGSSSSPNLRTSENYGRSLTSFPTTMCRSNFTFDGQVPIQLARSILLGPVAILRVTVRRNPYIIQQPVSY